MIQCEEKEYGLISRYIANALKTTTVKSQVVLSFVVPITVKF